jgi:hypothetical protein
LHRIPDDRFRWVLLASGQTVPNRDQNFAFIHNPSGDIEIRPAAPPPAFLVADIREIDRQFLNSGRF